MKTAPAAAVPAAKTSLHPCRQCAFFDDSIWRPAEHETLCTLTRGFTRKILGREQVLWGQGSPNSGIACVSSGLIALRAYQQDGRSALLRLAYPGDVIGFRSFLEGGEHQTEARALLPSRVCAVAPQAAGQIVGTSPEVLKRLAGRCAREVGSSRDRIIAAGAPSNKDRLAALLFSLLKAHGDAKDSRIRMRLPLSRADLADLLGVQRETLSRLLGRLSRDGLFLIDGRDVSIHAADLEAAAVSQRGVA